MNTAPTFAAKTAFGAFVTLSSVILFSVLCFAIGIPVGAYTLLLPCAALMVAFFFKDRQQFYALLLVYGIFALWTFICSFILDWSFDGMYYHKQAIITLKEGWNPFRGSSLAADVFASYPDMALWLDNYPKGIWVFSSAIYALTNHLETAKAVNILFLIPVFAVGMDAFQTVYGFNRVKCILFSALLVINPVFLCQMFTSYNDLAVGALIITAALLCMKIISETASWHTYALLFLTAAISCTVKFTAPVLVGIVILAFGIAYGLQVKWNWKKLKKPVLVVLSAFLCGVVILGVDPYGKHILEGKHPVYPVMGQGKYDIMNTNPPKGMDETNGLSRLFVSLFSQTENDITKEPKLKLPFTIHKAEWDHLSTADIRIGGFGVFFSGILLLSLALLVVSLFRNQKMRRPTAVLLIVFGLLTLFFPESWWARYTSYTYYIPVFLLIHSTDRKGVSPIKGLVLLLLLANSFFFLQAVLSTGWETTAQVNASLAEIKSHNQKVLLRVNSFPTHVKLFEEYGIPFEVTHTAIEDPLVFYRDTKYKYMD